MSMDNGYVIRQNSACKYVLQMYFDSASNYPSVEDPKAPQFDTVEEAEAEYERKWQESWKQGYPLDEYGLHLQIGKAP